MYARSIRFATCQGASGNTEVRMRFKSSVIFGCLAGSTMAASSSIPLRTVARRTTQEIALPFLRQGFIAGDSIGAYRRFAAPDLIQHNPEMQDGLANREAFFQRRARELPSHYPPPASWANVVNAIIVDGDFFAVHHHAFM